MPFVNAKQGGSINAIRERESANPGSTQPSGTEREADGAAAILRWQLHRWGHIAVAALVAAVAVWVIGREAARRIEQDDIARSSRGQPPTACTIRLSQEAEYNNLIAAKGQAVDLEGMAIVYPEEMRGLVTPGGAFRIDLPSAALAAILKVDPATIANQHAPTEVDPEAVLFRVVTGRLTARCRILFREERRQQARDSNLASSVVAEWTKQEVPFTLVTFRRPDAARKTILEAIGRSATLTLPQPGEKVRATPLARWEFATGPDLWLGYLPLERPSR